MKLYVLVRRDLSLSQQAVQAGHAVAEYILRGPEDPNKDNWSNGTLVYLGVKDLCKLEEWMFKLDIHDIKYSVFKEPDIGNQPTALATLDGRLFKNLQLL